MKFDRTAELLHALYVKHDTKDEMARSAMNQLIVGRKEIAEMAWHCFDVAYEQNKEAMP